MTLSILGRSFLVGLTIAASVGPVSLLLIQRILQRGWLYGFVSGLGAALADGVYGFIGGIGLVAVTEFLVSQQSSMKLAGSAVLVYIGLSLALSPLAAKAAEDKAASRSYIASFTSIFFLTLSNPITVLFFASLYAGVDLGGDGRWRTALLFGTGIFCGSALWWLALAGLVTKFRERVTPVMLLWLNRVSGAVIALYGVVGVWGVVFS